MTGTAFPLTETVTGLRGLNPVPITVDEVEHRFKVIARATAQKYPELKIDPKKIYPYIGRQKVSTLLTDIAKDKGLLASEILRHRDTSPGRAKGSLHLSMEADI